MITIGIDASRAEAKLKTGVERYSYELLLAMRETLPSGVKVILYSRVALPPELGPFDENWKNAVLAWPPKRLWTQVRLSWEMLRRPPDVLFAMVHDLPRLLPNRTVRTIHDAFPLYKPEMFPFFQRLFLNSSTHNSCERATEIIVPSEFVAKQIASWRTKNVFVIPHGVRVDFEKSKTKKAKPSAEKYFIVVGRIEKKKNLGIVIEAFSKFQKYHPDFKLYLVGREASGSGEIVRQAQKSSSAQSIEFRGALPDQEMFALMAGAVALLHPCPYEGFGMPAIEAMSLGVPVVAANSGAVAEAVGDAGLLVDPNDTGKWAEAMNQTTFDIFHQTLIAKGKVRASEFSWKKASGASWRVLLGRDNDSH